MRAFFKSKNLIGDGIQIGPALRMWYKNHPDWDIDLLTNNDHVAALYSHMGIPINVIFAVDESVHYDFSFNFDVGQAFTIGEHGMHPVQNRKLMMAECYMHMLGLAIANVSLEELAPVFIPEAPAEPHYSASEGLIAVAPFSRSCSVHTSGVPNKTLPWQVWSVIIRYLRALGLPLCLLGGPDDMAPSELFDANEYFTGHSLNDVATLLRDRVRFLVSIDNGMSHLAASQQTPHLLYYPACLSMSWAVPWTNTNLVPIQLDPSMLLNDGRALMEVLDMTKMIISRGFYTNDGTRVASLMERRS